MTPLPSPRPRSTPLRGPTLPGPGAPSLNVSLSRSCQYPSGPDCGWLVRCGQPRHNPPQRPDNVGPPAPATILGSQPRQTTSTPGPSPLPAQPRSTPLRGPTLPGPGAPSLNLSPSRPCQYPSRPGCGWLVRCGQLPQRPATVGPRAALGVSAPNRLGLGDAGPHAPATIVGLNAPLTNVGRQPPPNNVGQQAPPNNVGRQPLLGSAGARLARWGGLVLCGGGLAVASFADRAMLFGPCFAVLPRVVQGPRTKQVRPIEQSSKLAPHRNAAGEPLIVDGEAEHESRTSQPVTP
ncbi:hypothetical protein CLV68_6528 [Actinokineospora cianjurensis]|uniref:Uncharacterized protein n=1 Tax=Actinokineospora cianjurensis TaxID=585224 RepID=A0A421AWB1_9PSEU|nr:hypothetical protein CLV68_6528 [Actinokineospora cianjurensis]